MQDEMRQAFAIFDGQEAGCHRYAGFDLEIRARVAVENCDNAAPGLAARRTASPSRGLELLMPPEFGWLHRALDALRRFR